MMSIGGGCRKLTLFLERLDLSIFSDSEKRSLLFFVLDFTEKIVEKKKEQEEQARYLKK